jgi:hypothetical protein
MLLPIMLHGAEAGSKFSVKAFPTIQYAYGEIADDTPSNYAPNTPLANRIVRRQPLHLLVVFLKPKTQPKDQGNS